MGAGKIILANRHPKYSVSLWKGQSWHLHVYKEKKAFHFQHIATLWTYMQSSPLKLQVNKKQPSTRYRKATQFMVGLLSELAKLCHIRVQLSPFLPTQGEAKPVFAVVCSITYMFKHGSRCPTAVSQWNAKWCCDQIPSQP